MSKRYVKAVISGISTIVDFVGHHACLPRQELSNARRTEALSTLQSLSLDLTGNLVLTFEKGYSVSGLAQNVPPRLVSIFPTWHALDLSVPIPFPSETFVQ